MRPRVTLPFSLIWFAAFIAMSIGIANESAHVAAGARKDQRVDADDFALDVEQRAARIAGVDRGVGLDVRDEVFLRQIAALRADDAGGHRVLEAERLADRDHPFADLQLVGVADRDLRQVLRLDLEQRHVGALVGADDLGLELALVGELDVDFVGAVDDMRVGDEEAVGRNDEAGADRLLVEITLGPRRGAGPGRSGGRIRRTDRPRTARGPRERLIFCVTSMLTTAGACFS